jgi:hypothetical protein
MSDHSVHAALRSDARLVVVEAPAGCGKTYQGASYATDIASTLDMGRVLILTHTHAACDVFAKRAAAARRRVEVATIDSLIAHIASAYHPALGLPADTGSWARGRKHGYEELAGKVAKLLRGSPMIAQALSYRYPVVICDEHQDASNHQHAVVMAIHQAGALLRVFADPMQAIYGRHKKGVGPPDDARWQSVRDAADHADELDTPHRWAETAENLGRWILAARKLLKDGGQIDLRTGLPSMIMLITAEDQSRRARGAYSVRPAERKPIDGQVNGLSGLLILSSENDTVQALRAFFNRRLPIWEGHVRDYLSTLLTSIKEANGNVGAIATAAMMFVQEMGIGFSPAAFGNPVVAEVTQGCTRRCRGKPALLQRLGKYILDQPDHRGVAAMLGQLRELMADEKAFQDMRIDRPHEFGDAVWIGQFDCPDTGFAERARRRSFARPMPPDRCLTTIHKAKGLECDHAMIIPCDGRHFDNSVRARRRLYVAMSRARRSLTFVVSRQQPSPLFLL